MFAKGDKKVGNEKSSGSGVNNIDRGTRITGEIDTDGNFRIDGELVGDIISAAKVYLGKSGKITGNIKAVNAEIEGHVVGDISVDQLLIVKETARTDGAVAYGKIAVSPGAEIVSSNVTVLNAGNNKEVKNAPRQQASARPVTKSV